MTRTVLQSLQVVALVVFGIVALPAQQHPATSRPDTQAPPPSNGVVEVRTLPGVDCTGGKSSDGALNALFQKTDYSLWSKTVSFRGCPMVRLDAQLLIRGQSKLQIDVAGSTIFGCNGSAGPLLLLQRSGNVIIDGGGSGTIWAWGGNRCGPGVTSKFTGSIGTANHVGAGGTEVTTTANIFRGLHLAPSSNAAIANYCALCTTAEENQEAYLIELNRVSCNGSPGSIGIGLLSGNAQSLGILRNQVIGCWFGIYLIAPYNDVAGNQFNANGDWDTFAPTVDNAGGRNYRASTYGAAIACHSGGNVIRFNNTSEHSGMFIWGRDDVGNTGCGASVEDNMFGPDYVYIASEYATSGKHHGYHAPPDTYVIDSGNGGNLYLKNNVAWNCTHRLAPGQPCIPNTRPIIGTAAHGADNKGGSQANYVDAGNNWLSPAFDPLPTYGRFEVTVAGGANNLPRITTSDEISEARNTGGYTASSPLKLFWIGDPYKTPNGRSDVYAIGALDTSANRSNSFHLDLIRSDLSSANRAVTEGLEFGPRIYGGLVTQPAPAISAAANGMGGGAGSAWGYKLCGISSGGTAYCTPEFSASNNATLDATHYNSIRYSIPAGYNTLQLWLTKAPAGATRTLGLLYQWPLLPSNTSSSFGPDPNVVRYDNFGYGYLDDKNLSTLAAGSPPATTADGRVSAAGPVAFGKKRFAELGTASDGAIVYCPDCDAPSSPGAACSSSNDKAGAEAHRIRGSWKCF